MDVYALIVFLLGAAPPAFLFLLCFVEERREMPSPVKILAWTLLFGFTLKSLYLAGALQFGTPFRNDYLSRDIIHLGQLAILIGTVCFAAGYVATQKVPGLAPRPWAMPISPVAVFVLVFAASFAMMALFFYKMGFVAQVMSLRFSASKFFVQEGTGVQSSLGYLTVGGDLIVVAFLYYFTFAKRISPYNVIVLALAFVCVCYFLSSRRNGVLIVLVLLAILFNVRHGRTDILVSLKRYAVIGAVILALSFVGLVRQSGGNKALSSYQIADAIAVTYTQSMQGAYFLDPAKTAIIMDQTSKRDLFLYGSSFVNFFAFPVPRVLWPGKPQIRIGPYVAQVLLHYDNASGAPPGGVGELYMNFGWGGLIVGMTLVGVLSAIAWRRLNSYEDMRWGAVPFALNMLCIILFLVTDFSFAIISLIRYQIAIYICSAFWRYLHKQENLEDPPERLGSFGGAPLNT